MKLLNLEELIFLGDSTIEWLFRRNDYDDYKPVKEAFEYLVASKVSKSFNGGFIVTIEELPIFFKHLFWLGRSNAVTSYVHFLNGDQSFVGSICQYGNIHFSTLNTSTDDKFRKFLSQSLFSELEYQGCYNQFSKSNAIKGRRTAV